MPLRVPFEFRLQRDATTAEGEFPSLKAFFGAAKERAQRGAATKKKNKAKAKESAETQAPSQTQSAAVVTDPLKTAAVRLLN
jgi:hypothetical protein